jgi:Na+/melibiose symporter-like transporter
MPLSPERSARWQPTSALASVNAAITLSWIIYRIHLPSLVTQAGFPATFAPLLLLIDSILAIGVEPWAGLTSDRTLRQAGGRFPIILAGAGLTALLFVLLPGVVSRLQPDPALNWWLPVLLILWAIAISLFRSPALALLSQYASPKQLPQAASLVVLLGGLASLATPLASSWLLDLGIMTTFGLAAVLLLVTVAWLQFSNARATGLLGALGTGRFSGLRPRVGLGLNASALIKIFGLGFAVTLTLRLAVELFPKILKPAGLTPPPIIATLLLSLALGALAAGQLAKRWPYLTIMRVGFGLSAVGLPLMLLGRQPLLAFGIAIGLGLSLGLVFNGTLPFVLNLTSVPQAGLGMGVFYAGAAAASSLYSGWLVTFLSPVMGIGLALLALVIGSGCTASRSAHG